MAAFFGADEIWERNDRDGREAVVLVGVRETNAEKPVPEEEFQHSLSELAELAKACGMEPVDTVTQSLAHISAGLYVGSGKGEEIKVIAEMFGAKRVIFNDTLSPSQIRNLQKLLGLPVMDRTALILEIFERRARTREARLQVELAKLRYLKPRLIGMWETQNRQGGASGSMSAKGEGENSETSITLVGNVMSQGENGARGIVLEAVSGAKMDAALSGGNIVVNSAGNREHPMGIYVSNTGSEISVDMTGSITVTGSNTTTGVMLEANATDKNSPASTTLIVTGDVTADSYGAVMFVGENSEADLVVDGTLEGGEAGLVLQQKTQLSEDVTMTVWKVEPVDDAVVYTLNANPGDGHGPSDGGSANKLQKAGQEVDEQVRYIIRISDKIHLNFYKRLFSIIKERHS